MAGHPDLDRLASDGSAPRRTIAVVALVATLLFGGAATFLSVLNARQAASNTNQSASNAASDSITRQLSESLQALNGLNGLSVDGAVSREEFAAFAADLLPGSSFVTLAREEIVDDADRDLFERRTGISIVDTDGAGGFVPAARRAQHVVVVDVYPNNENSRSIIGFDITSDPARTEAMVTSSTSGQPALSRPTKLADSAQPGLFVISAAQNSQGATVGYVSSGLSLESLVDTARRSFLLPVEIGVRDGDTVLAGNDQRGSVSMADVGGRSWTVTVSGYDIPDYSTAELIALTAALLAGLLVFGIRADARHRRRNSVIQQELVRTARRSNALAEISHRLALARTTSEVTATIVEHLPDVVGADHANVGFVEGDQLVMASDMSSGISDDVRSMYRSLPLESQVATTRAARTGTVVLASDLDAYQQEWGLHRDTAVTGFASLAAVPMSDTPNNTIGVLGLAWRTPIEFDSILSDTLTTVGELCGQTLVRARLSDLRLRTAERAGRVADLASALAGATTIAQVSEIAASRVARLLETTLCTLTILDDESRNLEIRSVAAPADVEMSQYVSIKAEEFLPRAEVVRTGLPLLFVDTASATSAFPGLAADLRDADIDGSAFWPLRNSDDNVTGVLGFGWSHRVDFDEPLMVAIQTAVDLCSQALERAQLYDAEHSLVDALQQRVLRPPPPVAGLDVHSVYMSAAQLVRMGGDWYEGALLADGRLALVVGDVVGHGVEAAADMAQIRNLVSAFLRSGTEPGDIFPLVSELLADDRMVTATATIVWIDEQNSRLRYVSAGHPPALVKHPDGHVEILDGGRQPLLGVTSASVEAGECDFAPGAVLVVYTDGLIERRTEDILTSIDRFARSLSASEETIAREIANGLMERAVEGRDQDDDIALVVVRHVLPTAG